jgi:RNA polymerase sigma factor (sigma-70 family)
MVTSNSVITLGKQIRTLFDVGALGAMPDRALLDQFARGGETSEPAFATLVERHGPMVLRVCRQLLADGHLAEDAFQVTFLLLARRARSIHNPDALAGWLHRVARRVALRALGGIRRRNDRERAEAGEIAAAADDNPLERAEVSAIVHEEIDRLGDAQRLPILLCALEGLSHEEAAQRLRWPVGTVKSRLVRGRRRLEGRLARRGLAPAVALAAGLAATPATAVPVPLALAVATTWGALQGTAVTTGTAGPVSTFAPVSSSIFLLLQKELSAIFLAKVALAAVMTIVVGATVALIGLALAGLPGQHTQSIELRSVKTETNEAKAPIVARRDITGVPKTDPGIPESQAAIPDEKKATTVVVVPERRLSAFGERVDRAIHGGVDFLKARQRPDGSWPDIELETKTGATSLVTLALLAAGEKPDSPTVKKSLEYLRHFNSATLNSTYAISLQTQVFAAAEPHRDVLRIAANVNWLERAQCRQGEPVLWPGSWTYSDAKRARPGDNSNTQFALVGLSAAAEAGVSVKRVVWELSRSYWERAQKRDGSWAYTPDAASPTASMTCAGVSSMAISGRGQLRGLEFLKDDVIHDCGKGAMDRKLRAGIDWLGSHFQVRENFGGGKQWRFYYLYGLERAGRLAGIRFLGEHDWYRVGAEELVHEQHNPGGYWQGALMETDQVLATSFALLFLAKGRAPVLINKLRHGSADDWNNDPDDVQNLVSIVSADWKHLLTWQMVDSKKASVPDLLRAPILLINGHNAPEFTGSEKNNLREYVERGGFIFAEACCSSADFDQGIKELIAELFPEKGNELRPLADGHPIWQSRHLLAAGVHPLWGITRGGRTAVVYSPRDLSCFWNQANRDPANPAVIKAVKIGQNVVDAVTNRKLPPDKLSDN